MGDASILVIIRRTDTVKASADGHHGAYININLRTVIPLAHLQGRVYHVTQKAPRLKIASVAFYAAASSPPSGNRASRYSANMRQTSTADKIPASLPRRKTIADPM